MGWLPNHLPAGCCSGRRVLAASKLTWNLAIGWFRAATAPSTQGCARYARVPGQDEYETAGLSGHRCTEGWLTKPPPWGPGR